MITTDPSVASSSGSRLYGSPRSERRAIEVQQALMSLGHHRAVKLTDLLIVSTGQIEGLTVLHDDANFDRLVTVTDQPVVWVAPAGTVSCIDAPCLGSGNLMPG